MPEKYGFCDLFKRVDLYGKPVSVNFRHKNFYQTRFGALLSILTAIFILTYFSIQLDKLVARRNPDVMSNTVLGDMASGDPI